jgi:hypothetical protein
MIEHQARQDVLARRFVHLHHGKTGHFSSSFNGVMYRDNSLWAASRQRAKLLDADNKVNELSSYNRMNLRQRLDFKKQEQEKAKLEMVEQYKEKIIFCSQWDVEHLNEQRLLMKLETKWQIQKEIRAATTI